MMIEIWALIYVWSIAWVSDYIADDWFETHEKAVLILGAPLAVVADIYMFHRDVWKSSAV